MKNSHRILLINAVNPDVEVETRHPHLGLSYLASSVRHNLPDAKIEFRIIDKKIEATSGEFKPHLVGIASVSQNFEIAKRYADFFAELGIPVILGGIHVSVLPRSMPRSATAACLGEGELTFVDIVRSQIEGKLEQNLNSIPGIAYWENDNLRLTEDRPVVIDLDQLPLPERGLVDIRPHTYMFTSRGCPYRCSFCASTRFWDKLRYFSAEYVVDEIELLVRKYKVNLISLFDDLFIAKRSRLEQIVILMEKRRLLGKVKFTASCRANLVKPDLAKLLARLGVVSACMGLESGDDETLRFLKGGNITVAQNHAAVNYLKDAGIYVGGGFVIGSPRETRAQIMKTYNFIRKSRLDVFDVYLLTPFPGTPIWEYAKQRGLVSDDMPDWSRLDINAYRAPEKAIILSEVLDAKKLLGLYKKFLRYRIWHNLIHLWRHPLRHLFPRMAGLMFLDFMKRKLKLRNSKK